MFIFIIINELKLIFIIIKILIAIRSYKHASHLSVVCIYNFSNFNHKVILFYIIIKSSYQFTYKPKISFTIDISFKNFVVFNDLY